MKILQITNKVPYPAIDGGSIACMNLTRGFALNGHKVTVMAMNTRKHHVIPTALPESLKDLADFRLVEVPAHINPFAAVINLIFSRKPYNAVRFISNTFQKELTRLLSKKRFDIIQLEGLYVCPYIPVIRKYSNAKIVYRAHNIEHEIWQRTAAMSNGWQKHYFRILAKRIRRFETKLLNSYDLLVPITERDGKILDQMGNIRPKHVSQTGIDSSVLIPNAKKLVHPTLFHIGSLDWTPNQEGLIWFFDHCWPVIHEKFPDLKFYLAGRNAPHWLIRKMDLPGVVFEGEVPDAYEFMNSRSIMVVPLFSGSGMRIKIIEGMALGKPIITTSVGTEGISTTAGENIMIAETAGEFVDAVSGLISDRVLFDRIGRNAIEYIHKKFDNLSAAGRLIEFYQKYTP